MDRKDSKEIQAYQAAAKYHYTFRMRMKFLWLYMKVNFMCTLLLIPEALKGLKNWLIPPKPKSVKGKVVLITGGGNGLGRAIAFRLAKEKCKLAIVDIDLSAAQKTANEISSKFKVIALPFKVDVSKHEAITKLKVDVESQLGYVDMLVNNAGLLSMDTSLREGTPEAIQKVVDVNLTSHFWTLRTFLNGMVERKQGHVVAIGSFAGKVTIPCAVAYCATKYGVTGFMDALFDELCLLEQDFIKTTTVFPMFINTRKELGERLDESGSIPRFDPDYAAHQIVKGILLNRRKIYMPPFAKHSLIINWLPDRIIKYVKTETMDASKLKMERLQKV